MTANEKKTFVLDTNVILHDYRSIYNFTNNDIVIPIVVLEELDKFKKGNDLINFHAREFARELDKISEKDFFDKGAALGKGRGRLFIQPGVKFSQKMKDSFSDDTPDHRMLAVTEYISEKMKIVPIIYGGGQQKGMRSGTDNVPGIAGLGLASKMVYDHLEENDKHMRGLRTYFVRELAKMDQVVVHGPQGEEAAPQIVSAAFVGVRSEVLLHTLEERGIYVSAGSACSTHKRSGSPTLTAIGLPKNQMEATVRFSFCETTTREELDYTLQVLNEVIPMLRRYARH